jgi:dephospho-CoA kinase
MEQVASAIICFSGRMRSGKSTTSRAIESKLGWKRVSFGEFILQKAKAAGRDFEDRSTLQQIGTELIESGWPNFVSAVLESADWNRGDPLIIDGIRHLEAISCITEFTKPLPVILIYVEIDESIRQQRVSNTENYDPKTEDHDVELESKSSLREAANLVVCGSISQSAQIVQILDYLGSIE